MLQTKVIVFALVIANPTITIRETKPLKSTVALVIDRSGSQMLSESPSQTEKLVEDVKQKPGPNPFCT